MFGLQKSHKHGDTVDDDKWFHLNRYYKKSTSKGWNDRFFKCQPEKRLIINSAR